jgi:hypothetical protein
MKHYNYLFTGAGLSALMTVYKMAISGKFKDKQLVLLDQNLKKNNDRTWCFWEDSKGNWESIISKKWKSALFASNSLTRELNFTPYSYQMIRGIDFYDLVFKELSKHDNITFINQKVVDFEETVTGITVRTETEIFSSDYVINSIFDPSEIDSQSQYPFLKQHFIGWFIKSEQPIFNENQATFMDFSVEQKGNTRFMYVLPTSKTEALVEYTLFSHHHLETLEYENEIQKYLAKLGTLKYDIIDKEQGSIPMTCYPFWKNNTVRFLNIGSAGGWTKASTGFTFKNADKKSTDLVQFMSSKSDFRLFNKLRKFWLYDLLLLDILDRNNELGATIFSALFKKGNPSLILKFLDEETSLWEDLQVIWKCPKRLFLKALIRVLFKPRR